MGRPLKLPRRGCEPWWLVFIRSCFGKGIPSGMDRSAHSPSDRDHSLADVGIWEGDGGVVEDVAYGALEGGSHLGALLDSLGME